MMSRPVVSLVLVEDDHEDIEIFTEILSTVTKDVLLTTIEDGLIAQKMLFSGELKADILFLDLRIPRLDGLELLSLIRQDTALACMQVVVHTAVDNALIKSRCNELGIQDFVLKEPSNEKLKAVLRSVLKK